MNIHTVFAHRPAFRTVVQLKAPLEITAPTSQLVNLRHVGVGLAPPPPAGSMGDLSFTHTQSPAADVWTVNHNLGKRPAVSVLTTGGVQVWGEVLHASANQAFLYFDSPLAGLAICS